MSDEKDTAAAKRAAHVAALKEERAGYERRGLVDRVKQVDAELARFGAKPKGRAASKSEKAEG